MININSREHRDRTKKTKSPQSLCMEIGTRSQVKFIATAILLISVCGEGELNNYVCADALL